MKTFYYPAPMPQDAPDVGRVILRDGTLAWLRPANLEDRERVVAFLASLSQETLRSRFQGGVRPEHVAEGFLTREAPEERLVLLVLAGEPEHPVIIAIGEYAREDADTAEISFLVADPQQGKGLGTLLLERLALVAARHGIRRFRAFTERRNRRMLDVFRESGFVVEEEREEGEVVASFSILPSRESVARAEMRERIATVASLRPFFKPRGVAVIGASRDPKSIGQRILMNLVLNRFSGPVYPVNPRAEVVGSIPAYPSVEAVPGPVDLAVVAVARDHVLGVVQSCGRKGVRGLIIISAGFAETGAEGRALQDRLVATARGYGMRVVGPNCLGVISAAPEVSLNASFAPGFPAFGPIAMTSQSGALGLAILDYARDLGLGISGFVSMGNKADISGNDLLQYWEDDQATGLILLYLESFGNPRRFARLARRVARKKPVLAVKAGRSVAGGRAASSHTAALVASNVAVEALFHQTGVIRCETLEEMFGVASLLASQPLPKGPRVAVVSNAGGPAILATDALEAGGLEIPEPSQETRERLKTFLPPAASLNNPIDMIASAGALELRRTLAAVLDDATFDAALVIFIPVGFEGAEAVAAAVREAVAQARAAGNDKPVLACFMSSRGLDTPLSPIPSYRFPESAAKALAQAYGYARWRGLPLGDIPDFADIEPERAREVCRAVQARGGGWLDPNEISEVLLSFGLPPLAGRLVENAEAAVVAAEAIGYPVALKLASRTLLHKSDWEGVRLGLMSAEAVREAGAEIARRLESAGKLAELEGFLVQPMVAGGVELMLGMSHDPLFGPLLAFGLGGIHVEVLRDVVFRITPLTDHDAEEMLRGIKGYRLLSGYRGAPAVDLEALKELLLRLSRLVEEVPEITELDLNPIKAFPRGRSCAVLDARIRVSA